MSFKKAKFGLENLIQIDVWTCNIYAKLAKVLDLKGHVRG